MEFTENEQTELKKSTSELKEAIISITAILNKHGNGKIYFGIKNSGEAVGQPVSEATIREIAKSISDNIKPEIYPTIEKILINEKDCIKVLFSGDEKPYYAYGRVYLRVGDIDKQISPEKVKRLILENSEFSWEAEKSDKTIKDVNISILKKYVEKANDAKRINFKFTSANAVLNKLKLISYGWLVNAGKYLFCDDNSFDVQAAIFAGKDKQTFLDIKQIKGNIFTVLEESKLYLLQHIRWRAKLSIDGRAEIPEVPVRALEEALVNSICHRDYKNPKGNEIAIFSDRIEIYNPGKFPEDIEPEDYIKGSERSELRNPLLANILFLSKDIEKWGSGIRRIYLECKENNLNVEFKRLKTGFLVVFYRLENFEDALTEELSGGLSGGLKLVYELISKRNGIKAKEIAQELKIPMRTIERNVTKLVGMGKIERKGSRKTGGYYIKEEHK